MQASAPGSERMPRRPVSAQGDSRVPIVLLVPALLGLALLLLPMAALVVRAPWEQLPEIVGSPEVLAALRLSLTTATVTTAICVICGVPLAWLLARTTVPGRGLLRALITVPLVLPPVIGGVALLVAFGRRGLVGEWLYETFGVSLPFTTTAVVMAQSFVALPFLVVAVEGALRTADRRYEEVAATLGASAWTTFRRVTLPGVAPGVLAGAVLCWARALGEFGATVTFAGSFPGTTRTLPPAAYAAINAGGVEVAIVLSLLMMTVSVTVLVALRDRWVNTR
jgi:molybdate transport system permease protein